MKRSFALEPFSRDHNDGLQLARVLKEDRQDATRMASEAWDRELADHFAMEEAFLGPLAGVLFEQMISEHRRIAQLVSELPMRTRVLGLALEEHIRWEERVLFPAIEACLTPETEGELTKAAYEMERRRWVTSPNRERLVRRRIQ